MAALTVPHSTFVNRPLQWRSLWRLFLNRLHTELYLHLSVHDSKDACVKIWALLRPVDRAPILDAFRAGERFDASVRRGYVATPDRLVALRDALLTTSAA